VPLCRIKYHLHPLTNEASQKPDAPLSVEFFSIINRSECLDYDNRKKKCSSIKSSYVISRLSLNGCCRCFHSLLNFAFLPVRKFCRSSLLTQVSLSFRPPIPRVLSTPRLRPPAASSRREPSSPTPRELPSKRCVNTLERTRFPHLLSHFPLVFAIGDELVKSFLLGLYVHSPCC